MIYCPLNRWWSVECRKVLSLIEARKHLSFGEGRNSALSALIAALSLWLNAWSSFAKIPERKTYLTIFRGKNKSLINRLISTGCVNSTRDVSHEKGKKFLLPRQTWTPKLIEIIRRRGENHEQLIKFQSSDKLHLQASLLHDKCP